MCLRQVGADGPAEGCAGVCATGTDFECMSADLTALYA